MCSCEAFGKTGVPNARGFCLVCGEVVDGPPLLPDEPVGEWGIDRCRVCNQFLGMGLRALHLGICVRCKAQPQG